VAVEAERLRPNLLVGAGPVREEAWLGRRLRVGEAELEVTGSTERCVMVGHAQRDLPRRTSLLRTIVAWNDLCVGVYARVLRPGRIRVGDALYVD
jgi:MOSC domain-containing protein YiiM